MLRQTLGKCVVAVLGMAILLSAAVPDARLSVAAMQGDKKVVQSLLSQKVNVNDAQGDGTTALHWAAYRDDLGMAQLLLTAGANVKAATRLGNITPLFMAAKNGSAAMIQLLLKAGADANSSNATETTPLMLAAASGSADAVKVLLDNGANVNAKEAAYQQTAVMFAAALNRSEAIKILAAHGADLNAVSRVAPLYAKAPAGNRGGQGKAADQKAGADQKAQNQNRNAAPRGDRGNPTVMGGNTALHLAAREGQLDAVRALVDAGANVNLVNAADNLSSITEAILNSHFDVAKFLLDHGANPNLANTGGLSALYATIDARYANRTWYPALSTEQEKISHLELMAALLDKGADVNAKVGRDLWFRKFGGGGGPDPAGATAFWRAAQANDVDAMRLLVSRGAMPLPSLHGTSPLQVAAGMGISHQGSNFAPGARFATVKYLVEELGADVNSKDDRGYTPLHGVALTGDNEIIKYLVSKGANVKAKASSVAGREEGGDEDVANGTGDSVADYANGPGMNARVYPETITLLRQLGSEFSDNCRASVCVLKARPDPKADAKKPPQQ